MHIAMSLIAIARYTSFSEFVSLANNMERIRGIAITVILLLSMGKTVTNARETLRLGVFNDIRGFVPGMEIALETIRNDKTLPFTFEVTFNFTMCRASVAIRSFIDQIFSSTQNLAMLIGPECSVCSEPTAELAPNWNLIQISPGSTSPYLSNTRTFPNFIRTVSSDAEVVVGIIQAMKQFGWSRIALITQSENIFTFIATRLRQELAASNLQLITEFTFNTDQNVTQAVESLRNSPARIIFLNMYGRRAREIMCEAYKNQMHHPEYAWMFFNWWKIGWWLANSSCTIESSIDPTSLEKIVKSSLVFDHFPRIEDERKDEPNQGNITWNQYAAEYTRRYEILQNTYNNTRPALEDGAYMFDAIWTAALALNKTQSQLSRKNISLKDFTYKDEYGISNIIYEEALKLKFFGLSGDVTFLDNGDRLGKIRLLQYRRTMDDNSLEKVQFGRIINGKLKYDSGESDSTVFAGGIAQDEEYFRILLPLFVTYTILSVIGVIFALVCLLFNIWCRRQKLVKLGSPYVNIMIVAGAVVFYTTVILFGVDENVASHTTVNGLCHAKIWMVSIGFSLLFGTILAKTWRVHYIFNHARANSKFEVKDIYLFGIVGVLIIADIIILTPPTVVPNARLQRGQKEFEGNKANDLPAIVGVCTSNTSLIWLSFLFAYKGFVLLAGLFLAFETRRVKIKPLNDSRFITMSVYGLVIVSIALAPIGLLLQRYPNVQYGIIGIMILSSTSVILGLVFVTKMFKVYQDPEGTQCLTQNNTIQVTNKSIADENDEIYKRKIEDLNEKIKVINDELEMFKSEKACSEATNASKKDLEGNGVLSGIQCKE